MEFVADEPTLFPLPDSGKGVKFTSATAEIRRFAELGKDHGGLFTQKQAAVLLGLTKQAVNELVKRGLLKVFIMRDPDGEVMGKYVGGDDIIGWSQRNKQIGRPSRLRMLAASFDTR